MGKRKRRNMETDPKLVRLAKAYRNASPEARDAAHRAYTDYVRKHHTP